MTPLVSIIMPCFNAALLVEKAIRSVLDQSHTDFELILVNDGSTDHTGEILRQWADTHPHINVLSQDNKGVSAARNTGLAEASGKYVAFLDADDYWDKEFLTSMISALDESNAVLAYCGWQNVGATDVSTAPFVPPDYENAVKLESLFRNCRWPIHAALSLRSAIVEAGGFDTRFKTSEDYYLWLAIGGFKPIIRVPKVLAYYVHHGETQATSDPANMALNHFSVQREFLAKHPQLRELLGAERIADLTYGELLRKGYQCYWKRNLRCARRIFKAVMKSGYGTLSDWKYMAPSLLPFVAHEALLRKLNYEKGTPS